MGRAYQFGLLGYHISYTLSPQIFSRLFDQYNLNGKFSIIDMPPDKIQSEIENLRHLDAFSVTIPYKERIVPFLDDLSAHAKEIATVNAVKVENGKLIGFNTDGEGFLYPLIKSGFHPQTVLLMGTGGAARALAVAMLHRYPSVAITVCTRNEVSVETFASLLKPICSRGQEVTVMEFSQIGNDSEFDLIVNATPVGGKNLPGESLLPQNYEFRHCQICYDLNYSPPVTLMLQQAMAKGCQIINGLPMLAAQAAASFKIWTGIDADVSELEMMLGDKVR